MSSIRRTEQPQLTQTKEFIQNQPLTEQELIILRRLLEINLILGWSDQQLGKWLKDLPEETAEYYTLRITKEPHIEVLYRLAEYLLNQTYQEIKKSK